MKNLKSHIKAYEFIGKRVKIIYAKNKFQIGLESSIIDETRNTFVLEGNKRILKKDVTFRIYDKSKKIDIEGKMLIARPYDRVKRC